MGFKPYYKWITFNTISVASNILAYKSTVLNLIINGLPSIQYFFEDIYGYDEVLNLIINGLPSIHKLFSIILCISLISFKPYYKWITFNTFGHLLRKMQLLCFKPYYKWITFNTKDLSKEEEDELVEF